MKHLYWDFYLSNGKVSVEQGENDASNESAFGSLPGFPIVDDEELPEMGYTRMQNTVKYTTGNTLEIKSNSILLSSVE